MANSSEEELACLDERLDQRGLAAAAAARDDDRAMVPAHDSSVDKQTILRPVGGQQFGVFLTGGEQRGYLWSACKQLRFAREQVLAGAVLLTAGEGQPQ